MSDLERVAMRIYWAAYDQYLGPEFRHPHAVGKGWTMQQCWQSASEVQREMCRHQARCAIQEITTTTAKD